MDNQTLHEYDEYLSNIADGIGDRRDGGMTLPNKNGRVVLINLFYEEIVDFIGHEFAHVWYNHRQYLQENESLAKAKAKEWGFYPDFSFTPRK